MAIRDRSNREGLLSLSLLTRRMADGVDVSAAEVRSC
jgi:hypothetical protein